MNGLPSAFTRRRFTQLAAITVGTLALGACASETNNAPVSSSNEASDDEASIGEQKTDQSFDQQEGHQNEADTPADPAEQARAIAKERVQNMSLAQKVAQLFVVAPEALVPEALVEGVSPVTQAAEIGQAMVVDYPVGGFVYFAPNIVSPDQTTSLLSGTSQLFAESENVLPFLCVDEEGGSVARIAGNEAFGVQDVGDAADIGARDDAAAAKQAAEFIAEYASSLGFNCDFAPVADVVDPLVSDTMLLRSFSSDPAVASEMVRAQVEGFREKNLVSCAKHFPGIGSAAGDSHDDLITTGHTLDDMREVDLVPFEAAVDAGVPMIMVGHLNMLAVTGEDVPASLSPTVVQGLLRESLHFEDIVIADSLAMGAVANYYTSDQAAVAALCAGCDMLLMPENFQAAYQGIIDAVLSGVISEDRIVESVVRILSIKQRYFDAIG